MSLTKPTIAVFLGLAVSIVTLELCFRIHSSFFPDKEYPYPHAQDNVDMFVEADSMLGWSKIPNHEAWLTAKETRVFEQINSKGIRGPEYEYRRKPGTERILFIGDSYIHGYTVQFDELISEVTSKRLEKVFSTPFESIAAGTGGYSTDQQLIWFSNELHKYSPDQTVLVFCANDVFENSRNHYYQYPKPYFEIVDGSLQQRVGKVPSQEKNEEQEVNDSEASVLQMIMEEGRKRSAFMRWAAKRVYGSIAYQNYNRKKDLPTPHFNLFKKTETSRVARNLKLTEKLLEKFKEEVNAIGSQFVILFVPFRASVYPKMWNDTLAIYDLDQNEYDPDLLSKRLARISERLGIDYIDPTKTFRARLNDPNDLYLPLDGHWTAFGHETAAEVLSDYLIAKRSERRS